MASRNHLANVETIQSDCATGLPDGSIDVALLLRRVSQTGRSRLCA
ncbi:MAG: hypothetical protein U9Q37_07235 [Euryarchaeota archaeon]|nr:hypothetical protein [Euryarchaeota archaeon]